MIRQVIKSSCFNVIKFNNYYHLFLLLFFISSAPGTYSPEKVNSDRGPQYSLTGKGPAEKPTDTPGEIHKSEIHLQKLLFKI